MPESKPTIKELLEKITPGEWRFETELEPSVDSLTGLPYLRVFAGGIEIVRVHGNGKVYSKHDAELIARAPALARSHEALKARLREAAKLMPLGTAKRANWLVEATEALAEAEKVSRG